MRALVATGQPGGVRFVDVAAPTPEAGQVLVDVRALSVNRGELHRLAGATAGWRPGWDFAGTVRTGDPDRLPAGTRVFGTMPGGAWAEQVAPPADHMARLPASLTWAQGASLGVAGLTALRTLRLHPAGLDGARVLVTGAAGGVGRLAVQLASKAGAHVSAVVRSASRGVGLDELGVDVLVLSRDRLAGPYDLLLESVGGESLARAMDAVAPGGTVVTFGNSSRKPTTALINDFYANEGTLRGFFLWRDVQRQPPADDLALLARAVDGGDLVVDIGTAAPWTDVAAVLGRLRARQVRGKAVLVLDDPAA